MTTPCSKEREIATMAEKLNNIEKKVDSIDKKMSDFIASADNKYVNSKEFETYKKQGDVVLKIIYGIATFIILAVIGAALKLIIIS